MIFKVKTIESWLTECFYTVEANSFDEVSQIIHENGVSELTLKKYNTESVDDVEVISIERIV